MLKPHKPSALFSMTRGGFDYSPGSAGIILRQNHNLKPSVTPTLLVFIHCHAKKVKPG